MMINWYVIAAILVGVVYPVYAIWQGRKLKQMLDSGSITKKEIFKSTCVGLILLTSISLAPFWIGHTSLTIIGMAFITKPLYVIALLVVPLLVFWLLWQIRINQETAEKIQSQYASVSHLMPSTPGEYRLTVLVSYVAGICEEIVYRGFLLYFLSNYMHIIPAILLANLPFALAHLTSTGAKNTFMAFLLALVFTAAYLLTNSLWLPIFLHILVDLYSMTIYYRGYKTRAGIRRS